MQRPCKVCSHVVHGTRLGDGRLVFYCAKCMPAEMVELVEMPAGFENLMAGVVVRPSPVKRQPSSKPRSPKYMVMDEDGRRRWANVDKAAATERGQMIVHAHDGGESFAEIGRRLGISRERVRQIYVKHAH